MDGAYFQGLDSPSGNIGSRSRGALRSCRRTDFSLSFQLLVADLTGLEHLDNITEFHMSTDIVTDISPLLEAGLGEGAEIRLWGEPLDKNSIEVVIPQLEAAGVKVQF